jgi:hypothetical protein
MKSDTMELADKLREEFNNNVIVNHCIHNLDAGVYKTKEETLIACVKVLVRLNGILTNEIIKLVSKYG